MYSVTPHWAVQNFVKVLDGLIAEYRHSTYRDLRYIRKVVTKLQHKDKLREAAAEENERL